MLRITSILAAIAGLLLAAPMASARPDYPSLLDQLCTQQGRTPPNPAALALQQGGARADCALCHNFSSGGSPNAANLNSDGRSFASGNIDPFCTLVAMNQPPVLDPIGNQTVDVAGTLMFTVTAHDPDGDPLVLSVSPLPMGATFIETNPGEAVFTWVPTLDQSGLNTLRFSVDDGLATDFEDVVVTVGDVNAPPTLAPIGNQTVDVGSTIQIAISATDPESGILTYAFEGVPADATATDFGDGTAEIAWTPAAPETAQVTVTVTDDGIPNESDSETFRLRAVEPGAVGDLFVRRLSWNDRARKLKVKGGGLQMGQTVEVLEADSGALLGSKTVDDADGHFSLSIRPFVVPCAVILSVDGAEGAPMDVDRAPADCGQRLLARVNARWNCRTGELRVKGDRGPLGGSVQIYDADTDALLDEIATRHRGHFGDSISLAQSPASLKVVLLSNDTEWTLDPVTVRSRPRSCDAVPPDVGKPPKGDGGHDDVDDDVHGDDDDHGDDHGGVDDDHGIGDDD